MRCVLSGQARGPAPTGMENTILLLQFDKGGGEYLDNYVDCLFNVEVLVNFSEIFLRKRSLS